VLAVKVVLVVKAVCGKAVLPTGEGGRRVGALRVDSGWDRCNRGRVRGPPQWCVGLVSQSLCMPN
jgi:hypothetical protein